MNTEQDFWNLVNKDGSVHPILDTPCWIWTGRLTTKGYGDFGYGAEYHLAHRLAWFFTYGKFPEPCGCHKCDNPPCCNPEHIFEGTKSDNGKDMHQKGRAVHVRGSSHYKTILTNKQVKKIRELWAKHGVTQGKKGSITQGQLANDFGVGRTTINNIIRFVNWKVVA
jgi:hypothetical protein